MTWHIVTGEYPPQPGGVSDYTYRLVNRLAAAGDRIHVWAPAHSALLQTFMPARDRVEVHRLPGHFGFLWFINLHRGISQYPEPGIVLAQYVPHMYGWKSMNVALCCWLAFERSKNIWVMFHEVAFPFKRGQPWKHNFLALVHRIMAWSILRSATRSFTSIEPYLTMLGSLSSPRSSIGLLPIFSNVSFDLSKPKHAIAQGEFVGKRQHTLGVFSTFGAEICALLGPVLLKLLENPDMDVHLIGPASSYLNDFFRRNPRMKGRVGTSGRLDVSQIGPHLQACDVLLQLYPHGVCPSHGTFLAALASGVPVVTTPGDLTGSLLRESGAVAFAENNPAAIQSNVESLLRDRTAAHALGRRGRQFYAQYFNISNTIDTLRHAQEAIVPSLSVRRIVADTEYAPACAPFSRLPDTLASAKLPNPCE